jgi:hypothetical protein
MQNISDHRYKELRKIERKMLALEAGGVDSWTYYGEALKEYRKEEAQDELVNDYLVELEVAFLEGAYEPSERGAGFAATDDARANAETILNGFIQAIKENDKD